VAVYAISLLAPHVGGLMGGSKVTLNFGVASIETTLAEVTQALQMQIDTPSQEESEMLRDLQRDGPKAFASGIQDRAERKRWRPLRNSGLVLISPRAEIRACTATYRTG